MTIRTTLITTGLIAASLVSGAAQAALQGRDLNGSAGSFEAYYDTVLDITWLADADYAKTSGYDADGYMTWTVANTWAANLSFTDGVNVYDNWRLPLAKPLNGVSYVNNDGYNGSSDSGWNVTSPQSEMAHLFYGTLGNPGKWTTTGAETGCLYTASYCLDNVGPFINLKNSIFWSGSDIYGGGTTALNFNTFDGYQGPYSRSNSLGAFAVIDGDIAAVPEAQTYALMLAGLGLIGWRARRRG